MLLIINGKLFPVERAKVKLVLRSVIRHRENRHKLLDIIAHGVVTDIEIRRRLFVALILHINDFSAVIGVNRFGEKLLNLFARFGIRLNVIFLIIL